MKKTLNYQKILEEIYMEIAPTAHEGVVASYIPELAKVNPAYFGMSLLFTDERLFAIRDYELKFSIQSISKVLSLCLAFSITGDELWKRVGVEPSGSPFNSLVQLEYEQGIPRNPFINAGAIVLADVLHSLLSNPKQDVLNFFRKVTGTENIHFNEKVAASEMAYGFRNASLAYMLKSFGNLHNDVKAVLDLYCHICSIEMTCTELSRAFMFLANGGMLLNTGEQILTSSQTKRINAVMQTCGFYDESGDFSFKVGLPGKSGVGGGIVAVHPQQYTVAVWSPRLNPKGNSALGMKALELLTSKSGLSIF